MLQFFFFCFFFYGCIFFFFLGCSVGGSYLGNFTPVILISVAYRLKLQSNTNTQLYILTLGWVQFLCSIILFCVKQSSTGKHAFKLHYNAISIYNDDHDNTWFNPGVIKRLKLFIALINKYSSY